MSNQNWIIIPWINNPQATLDLLGDCWDQDIGDVKILLIGNGVSAKDRQYLENRNTGDSHTYFWTYKPKLSLSAVWNNALDFVWNCGGQNALVLNNDIRISTYTYRMLSDNMKDRNSLFVSGVNSPDKFDTGYMSWNRGGPDFSCFLISKECHQKYRFDENFFPAYCEDLDTHRKIMIAGEGHRIYSIDLPYMHNDNGSGSLKAMPAEKRQATEREINEISRAYYFRKWKGNVNEERTLEPFGPIPQGEGFCTSTAQMFNHKCNGRHDSAESDKRGEDKALQAEDEAVVRMAEVPNSERYFEED